MAGAAESYGAAGAIPVLELREVSRRFGGLVAVDRVSLAVRERSVVALIGPNGAGKSTLFALMMGELGLSGGAVRLDGRDVGGLSPSARVRAGIGRTFQTPRLFAGLSVWENMLAVPRSRQWASGPTEASAPSQASGLAAASGSTAARVGQALAEVGLGEHAQAPASTLSQGQRKRLELAMVLALQPRILLLDEPTAGMGVEERGTIMRLVSRAVKTRGLTMVFCEHDMESVFAHAARVVVMDRGAIVADGPPERVRADPHVQRIYLGGARTEATCD